MSPVLADPFADLEPGEAGLAEGRRRYRDLSRRWHPDVQGAHDAMAELNAAWDAAERRLRGDVPQVVVKSRRHTYAVLRPLVAGDVADLHVAERHDDEWVLKVARDPRDADLLAAEAASLKAIHAAHAAGCNGWFPWIGESFAFAAPGRPRRRCNVLEPLRGFYDLGQVTREPRPLHPRDVAWMARRVLHVLAQSHAAGRVHGGLVPEHVMVHPTGHHVVLVGWGGSVEVGQPMKVLARRYANWYPTEVGLREPVGPETDLFMFGRLLRVLATAADADSTAAGRFRAFGAGCAIRNRNLRPKDAHEVLADLDDLLERMWGRRTYHEFSMPGPSRI